MLLHRHVGRAIIFSIFVDLVARSKQDKETQTQIKRPEWVQCATSGFYGNAFMLSNEIPAKLSIMMNGNKAGSGTRQL